MVSIFVEGTLDEAVLRHIIGFKTNLKIGVAVSGKGRPYLAEKALSLNRSARGYPVILLADLDNPGACPHQLTQQWLRETDRSRRFLIRFAILAIEAWLLADRSGLSRFLHVSERMVPLNPDRVPTPKIAIVNLARSSRNRAIRDALVPAQGSKAVVGPSYNGELIRYVTQYWDIDVAASASDSLRRAVSRIEELAREVEA